MLREFVNPRLHGVVSWESHSQRSLIHGLIGKAVVISKLDLGFLRQEFLQIPIMKGDEAKTCFGVDNRRIAYRRMPYSLRNARAHFERVMDTEMAIRKASHEAAVPVAPSFRAASGGDLSIWRICSSTLYNDGSSVAQIVPNCYRIATKHPVLYLMDAVSLLRGEWPLGCTGYPHATFTLLRWIAPAFKTDISWHLLLRLTLAGTCLRDRHVSMYASECSRCCAALVKGIQSEIPWQALLHSNLV